MEVAVRSISWILQTLLEVHVVLFLQVAAYDKKEKKMSLFDPSRKEDFEFISGTKMRSLARSNQEPPQVSWTESHISFRDHFRVRGLWKQASESIWL